MREKFARTYNELFFIRFKVQVHVQCQMYPRSFGMLADGKYELGLEFWLGMYRRNNTKFHKNS